MDKCKCGVDMLLIVMNGGEGDRPVHASLAFTNTRCEIDAFYPNRDFDGEKAKNIWESARETRSKNQGDRK